MTKDFADFLESLNREGVAYVVIGGIAVLAHIPYRTTRDLDVLIAHHCERRTNTACCRGVGFIRAGVLGGGFYLRRHPFVWWTA